MQLQTLLTVSALSTLALSASAGTGTWSATDAELGSLASSFSAPGGPRFGALIRSSFDVSSDDRFQATAGEDLQGFRFQDAILWSEGAVGDFDWRMSFDFADSNAETATDGIGTATLRDAWARWNFNDQFQVYWGQFKCPVAQSAMVDQDHLLFIDRSRIGQFFDVYQPGVAVMGDMSQFHWKLAVQNGNDSVDDDHGITARVEYMVGAGSKGQEGSYGVQGDALNSTIGFSYFKDSDDVGANDEVGTVLLLDAGMTMGALSGFAEIGDFNEEFSEFTGLDAVAPIDSTNPWSASLGYMLVPNEWEVAARFEDLDDELDTSVITVGVNWYQAGHAAKWALNISDVSADDVGAVEGDGTIVRLGLTLGASR